MKEMMLPRIQALEAMETSRGGAEGPDEKWIIITIRQTVIISKMQARTEIEAVLCADQNFAVNVTGIESYLLAMDRPRLVVKKLRQRIKDQMKREERNSSIHCRQRCSGIEESDV
jgi:hypothetical protein